MKERELVAYNFKRLREAKGWTQEEAAVKGAVDQSYISQVETGLCGFGIRAKQKWAEIFGCGIIDFYKTDDIVERGVPVIANISAGEGIIAESPEQYETGDGFDYIPLPPGYTQEQAEAEGIYGLKVKGESMTPCLKDGWHLYVKPNADKSTIKTGDLVIFKDTEGTGWVKEIELLEDGTYVFKSIGQGATIIKKANEISVIEKIYLIMP